MSQETDLGYATINKAGIETKVKIIDAIEGANHERDIVISVAGLADDSLGLRIADQDAQQHVRLTPKTAGYLLATMSTYATLNKVDYLPTPSEIEFTCSDNLMKKLAEIREDEGFQKVSQGTEK